MCGRSSECSLDRDWLFSILSLRTFLVRAANTRDRLAMPTSPLNFHMGLFRRHHRHDNTSTYPPVSNFIHDFKHRPCSPSQCRRLYQCVVGQCPHALNTFWIELRTGLHTVALASAK